MSSQVAGPRIAGWLAIPSLIKKALDPSAFLLIESRLALQPDWPKQVEGDCVTAVQAECIRGRQPGSANRPFCRDSTQEA